MAIASYKCPQCGAGIEFDPDRQAVRCDFCRGDFSIQELEAYNRKLEDKAARDAQKEVSPDSVAAASPADQVAIQGYRCDSCGAEVVTDATTTATFCYYCHNPVLLTGRLTGEFRPHRIIPFVFSRDKAVSSFLKFAKSRSFVPKDFTSASQLEKITGMYLPYWVADYEADVDYQGKGINRKTWISGNTEYTETKEYRIDRQGKIAIDNVHELALQKIDRRMIESITPFDESKLTDFSLAYLSGFFAEKFDIPQEQVVPTVEHRVEGYADRLVRESFASYDQIDLDKTEVRLTPKAWEYALMPAWVLTYFYRGRTYIYAINGQTGKAHGELPVDKRKLSIVSLIIAAIVLLLLLLGGRFIW